MPRLVPRLVLLANKARHWQLTFGRLTLAVLWWPFWRSALPWRHGSCAGGTLLVRLGPLILAWKGRP